jgi:hypothetical protein
MADCAKKGRKKKGDDHWTRKFPERVARGDQHPAHLTKDRGLWKGEKNGNAKLTEKQVREIRAKYVPRKYGIDRLAAEYGIDRNHAWFIVKRKSWAHI